MTPTSALGVAGVHAIDNGESRASSSNGVTDVQASCHDRMASSVGAGLTVDHWCTDLIDWIDGYISNRGRRLDDAALVTVR